MARASKYLRKDISEFPFHLVYEEYTRGIIEYKEERLRKYKEFIRLKEVEYSGTHEAPYEGNFSEEYPYTEPSLSALREAGYRNMTTVFKSLGIKTASPWLMPQLLNYLNETVTLVKTASGQFDGFETVKLWVNKNKPRHLGMLYTIIYPTRSAIVNTQTSVDARDYCTLVPLFLAAFKRYRDVKYSDWDRDTLEHIVHAPLLEAMLHENIPDVSNEELAEVRSKGKLTNYVHKLASDVVSASKLAGLNDTLIVMLTQIWVADPSVRTKYMVLDPKSWDHIPPPIITIDLFNEKPGTDPWGTELITTEWKANIAPVDLPWND